MGVLDRKRRFRFGLRSLFVAMTLICLLFAMIAQPLMEARKQRQLVAQLEKLGAKLSNRGTVMRDTSVGRAIMGNFGNEYDRDFLHIVDLSGSSITDQDLALLIQLPYLFHLNLSGTKVTDTGLDSIASCSNLHELNLSNTQVTDAGILQLKALGKLAWLRTEGTAVTYSALTELDSQLPWANFAEQRAIAEVQSFGAQAPAHRRYFEHDEYPGLAIVRGAEELLSGDLILGMNRKLQLVRSDISHLAHLESLKNVDIHRAIIEPGSFTDVPTLPKLTSLTIAHTDITDRDMKFLTRQIHLEDVWIVNNKQVTDVGISELAKLRNLKTLKVDSCPNVTAGSINNLREKLPDCKISYVSYTR